MSALPPEIEYRSPCHDEYAVARICGTSVQSVRRWRAAGTGPRFRKIGALVRYSLADIFAWVEAQPGGGGAR
ncbi:MAG: helix-turn-helix domain-containing protein [Bryobacteraceae bacterium]|nr:helix-turn-helix domain-containing protein [Bryobacteraceae bacterium]